jgi:Tfp pilus assembly protein PilN
MPSINLLPKSFRLKGDENRQKRAIYVLSILLVSISAIFFAGVYIDKTIASKKSDLLDSEAKNINDNIEKEVNNNELFLIKDKIKDISDLLNNHHYFSRAFEVIQNVVADDVYLTESSLSLGADKNLVLKIGGVAENYLAVVNQIAIFKNSYWIESVNIGSISGDKDSEVSFDGELKLKKDLILHHEYYWDFGLALLSSKTNRYIKINEYSSVLKKSNNEDIVEVKFGGIAYDKQKLISFENDLREMGLFVRDMSISYDSSNKKNSDVIEFEGTMMLNY